MKAAAQPVLVFDGDGRPAIDWAGFQEFVQMPVEESMVLASAAARSNAFLLIGERQALPCWAAWAFATRLQSDGHISAHSLRQFSNLMDLAGAAYRPGQPSTPQTIERMN